MVAAGLMVLGVIAGFDALFAAASCCCRIASSCCFRSASKFAFCSAEYALPFAAAAALRPAQGGSVWTRLSFV